MEVITAETGLKTRRAEPALRAPRTSPSVPMVRKLPYWRRGRRVHLEHWVAGAIVALAFANAVRLLAF